MRQEDASLWIRPQSQRGLLKAGKLLLWLSNHAVIVHSNPRPEQVVGEHRARGRQGQLECLVYQHSVATEVLRKIRKNIQQVPACLTPRMPWSLSDTSGSRLLYSIQNSMINNGDLGGTQWPRLSSSNAIMRRPREMRPQHSSAVCNDKTCSISTD